ncbi:MAG: PAS domain S-box protein [Gammaproteobacteria bacterium]|nr:PAS domain S-box protein [Gammaproteobacteria bacterium]MBT8094383.1 PAS domain S-box protein [Gammaproteobacteria bacterium]MBT8104981.1 PAS domain S-box protein [Gammaproteobacteria bacterium]NNF50756.1 PAS domain S-box protein [Woeseiaceae bacterium]NNK24995.1 PAS domain S-box protein [Woeseiaceae bacterium]
MHKIPLPADIVSEILNTAADATIISDQHGQIFMANRRAEELFGYSSGGLVGLQVEDLVPEGEREHHLSVRGGYSEAPRARPMISGLDLRARRRDGETIQVEIALNPIETDDGPIITSTIRPSDQVEDSEAYFRQLLETAPDAMVITDERGTIAVVNHQAEEMFGYGRQELLGQPVEMLLPERLRRRHVGHRAEYLAQPRVRPMGIGMNLVGVRKDASEFPVEISLSQAHSMGGRFISSVIRDVTERKVMEEEIIAARQEAERANKANSAFLAAASHDLRQPVQAMSLLNGALRRTVTDERALQMIDSQQHSITAMTNLLNSLLDISRLDAGAVIPEVEQFPITRVIDRLSDEFARQAQQKGLEFSSNSCRAVVNTDPNLLAEVIQNFVSNAIRYTDKGSVRLECESEGDYCVVRVVDTGIGIADDQREEIFREFHQCKTRGASKEGFGLGLAIVKRLSDLLGLHLHVDSDVGQGSVFSVSMPAAQEMAIGPEETATDDAGPREAATGLVILIEDDVNVANAWGLLLEAEGFRVATAASAPEAKALMKHVGETPALLISDFHLLDGSTGVEAVSAIRKHYGASIPAFIVSGDTSKVVKDARLLDNCTLMCKPIDTNRLLAAARHAIHTGGVPLD